MILYDYQKKWIEDKNKFKIGMMSRQIGKSFSAGVEILYSCIIQKERWVILSRGERQAKEFMDEIIKVHLRAFELLYYRNNLELVNKKNIKSLEVILNNGSKITALPANPDTARGFSANVLLDEFAFHNDSDKIWSALFPVISKSNLKLRILSTPNGKNNKFYDLMTKDNPLWTRHIVNIYDAVKCGLPRNIEELRRACGDDVLWKREFELEWVDDATAWLDYDLIFSCEHEAAGRPEGYKYGYCYVGIDVAIRNDYFVIAVLEQVADVLWLRELITEKKITFSAQMMLLQEIMKKYHVSKIAIDQTGIGEMPVETIKSEYGESMVEGVIFSAPAKLDMATKLKKRFQDKTIRIPLDDNKLRIDLHSVERHLTKTGITSLRAERDETGHADRFWAIALAVALAPDDECLYDYIPVKS